MSQQNRTTDQQSNTKKTNVEQVVSAEPAAEFGELSDGEGVQLSAASGIPNENLVAAQLNDRRIPTVQRRALVEQVSKVQGNRHLQRIMTIQQDKHRVEASQFKAPDQVARKSTKSGPNKSKKDNQVVMQAQASSIIQKQGVLHDVEQAIRSKDIGAIKEFNAVTLKATTLRQKADMIKILLNQWWVGPFDEAAIVRLFEATNDIESLLNLLASRNDLERLINKVDRIDLEFNFINPEKKSIQEAFRKAAIDRATQFLTNNKRYLISLKEHYRLSDARCSLDDIPVINRVKLLQDRMTLYQNIASGILKLNTEIEGAKARVVTNEAIISRPGGVISPEEMSQEELSALNELTTDRLMIPDIREKLRILKFAKLTLQTQYPILMAFMQDGNLEEFSQMENSYEASKKIIQKINRVIEKIDETKQMIVEDDLNILEVPKILTLTRTENPSFSKPFAKWAITEMIENHENKQFWTAIGIGALTVAAFIASELATGGLATALWIGGITIGGVGLTMSIEEARDLVTASQTDIRENRKLIDKEIADSATLWATVEGILLLLDIFVGAAKGLRTLRGLKGARAGTARTVPQNSPGRSLFGKPSPPPSGRISPELRTQVLKQFNSRWFRFKLNLYAKIIGRRVNWDDLIKLVKSAEFREYANAWEALQSGGYAGISEGKLILGAAQPLRRIPILGNSTIQHELVHAYQELAEGVLTREATRQIRYSQILKYEVAANVFGSPGLLLFFTSSLVAISAGTVYIIAR